eukprot:Em0867g3a
MQQVGLKKLLQSDSATYDELLSNNEILPIILSPLSFYFPAIPCPSHPAPTLHRSHSLQPGDLSNWTSPRSQEEMGGLMAYSHQGWIKNRLEYERIQSAWKHTKEVVGSMRSSLDHFELPCNVAGAEFLIEDSLQRKEPLLGEMLEELKEEERGATLLAVHKARLDHILRVCQFRKSADKILDVLKEFSDILTTNLAIEINKETAIELGLKHNAFVVKCREVEMLSQEALEFLASQPLDDITATSAGNLMTTVDEHLSKLQPQLAKNLRKMAKALPGRYFNTMGKRTAKRMWVQGCGSRDVGPGMWPRDVGPGCGSRDVGPGMWPRDVAQGCGPRDVVQGCDPGMWVQGCGSRDVAQG